MKLSSVTLGTMGIDDLAADLELTADETAAIDAVEREHELFSE